MTSPPPTLPARVAAIAPLRRQGQRLLARLLRRSKTVVVSRGDLNGGDSFLEVGRRLRVARESHGLSLRQLAQETRISITVLEALEKGWRDRLPEPTYMRTMLALLEQHLALERGSMDAALPPRRPRSLRSSLQTHGERLPLTSIALFATWQGTVLYALLCLLLIYGLNRQQRRLVTQGLLPLHPVAAQPSSLSEITGGERDRARILAAYPDLRPLEGARQGQGLALLRRQEAPAVLPSRPGRRPSSSGGAGATDPPAASAAPGSVSGVAAGDGGSRVQDGGAPAPRP